MYLSTYLYLYIFTLIYTYTYTYIRLIYIASEQGVLNTKTTEVYSEALQTSKIELFAKIVNGFSDSLKNVFLIPTIRSAAWSYVKYPTVKRVEILGDTN